MAGLGEILDFSGLVAGLGLFLFGMNQLEASLESLAGRGFRRFLKVSTAKPVRSVAGGIVATVIVQSSSLVGLIVLALVGAGVIPLANAIGVVIGSNLGTTFTGWVVTAIGFKLDFSVAIYPLLALGGIGYGMLSGRGRATSQFLVGFAFLLMGLSFMKDSVAMLTQQFDLSGLSELPLLAFFAIGIVFTAIIQSSSATMMLTLSALNAEIIALPAAAALVIGADLGTTSTVALGSMQGAVIKRRVAAAHVLFNGVVDAAAFMALFPLLALVQRLQIQDPLYSLVMFHSLFNFFGILLFLPLVGRFSGLLERWIKDDSHEVRHFIHNVPHDVPDLALDAFEKETEHLLYRVAQLNTRESGLELEELDSLAGPLSGVQVQESDGANYGHVKRLEGYLISFASQVQRHPLDTDEVDRLEYLLSAIRHGVYSAKALRDIRKNVQYFTDLEAPVSWHPSSDVDDIFLAVYQRLIAVSRGDLSDEEQLFHLKELRQEISERHDALAQSIYDSADVLKISPVDLSTLFNVNKELQTSEKALTKAFEHLCKSRLAETMANQGK